MSDMKKQKFADRIVGLVKEYADAKLKQDGARDELERIFGRRWVTMLDTALEEERVNCPRCGRDDSETNVSDEGLCYVCSRAERIGISDSL